MFSSYVCQDNIFEILIYILFSWYFPLSLLCLQAYSHQGLLSWWKGWGGPESWYCLQAFVLKAMHLQGKDVSLGKNVVGRSGRTLDRAVGPGGLLDRLQEINCGLWPQTRDLWARSDFVWPYKFQSISMKNLGHITQSPGLGFSWITGRFGHPGSCLSQPLRGKEWTFPFVQVPTSPCCPSPDSCHSSWHSPCWAPDSRGSLSL